MTSQQNIYRLPFQNLFSDMNLYSKKKHAEIVYRKCIKAGKLILATKIAFHYNLQMGNKHNDISMSFGMALISSKINLIN